MKDLKFNIIECEIENKYIRKEKDVIVIDYIDEGFSYIRNDKDIYCNKIEVLNGFGVVMYYDDQIIKIFEKDFIKIEFNEKFNTIAFIDTKEKGLFQRFLCVYYQNEIVPKENKIDSKLTNKKYNIGDIVYPSKIGYYSNDDKSRLNTFRGTIFWEYLARIEGLKEKTISPEMFESFCTICAFKIIDKVGDKFYKIKLNHFDDSIKDLAETVFFATDETIDTLDEIKNSCEELKKMN